MACQLAWRFAILAAVAFCVQGCGTTRDRLPGFGAVSPGTDVSQDAAEAVDLPVSRRDHPRIVALSGGGPDGAFGAGYLVAQAADGCPPPDIVTGVSIGALVGTLAFVGDAQSLRHLFAEGGAARLAPSVNPLRAAFAGSLSSGEAYRRLIADFVTPEVIAKVAADHADGRRLYVATTDFDAMRMQVWNMGRIANLPEPWAQDLFHNILLGSASIPGVYPPVRLPGIAGSARLHVDAGSTGQVFLPVLPSGSRRPQVQVIFNNGLEGDPPLQQISVLGTVQRGLSTLIRAQSRQQVELARAMVKVSDGTVDVASIPATKPVARIQDFAPQGMAATFETGRRLARADGC
jgi:predicted acylesterase/phospholipase RssA